MTDIFIFPQPQYAVCKECGATVLAVDLEEHECDRKRRAFFQAAILAPTFEAEYHAWLDTPEGRFSQFYANHSRGAAA